MSTAYNKALQAITQASTEDVVTFCTVLDLSLEDLSVYSDEEKLGLLGHLGDLLEANPELLRQTAWDLYPLLERFLDSKWQHPANQGLRHSPEVMLFMRFSELLAVHGDPKELLLAACAQLETLDPKGEGYVHYRNTTLQFHSLMEIIGSCLRRNETLHPSKFLAEAVKALTRFLTQYSGPINGVTALPVTRRLYRFIRDYVPGDMPSSAKEEYTVAELEALVEDENYLQRRLLGLLLSITVEWHTRDMAPVLTALLVHGFPDAYVSHFREQLDFVARYVTLAMSMDLELDKLLKDQLDSCSELFSNVKSPDDIFSVVIDNYNSQLHERETKLTVSPLTVIILYTYGLLASRERLDTSFLQLAPLMRLQLKLFVPFSIKPSLVHLSSVVCCMVLTLEAAGRGDRLYVEDRLVILTYLQNLSALCMNAGDSVVSVFFNRFLAGILRVCPEEVAYEFLVDTARNCPFPDLQVRCMRILKEMERRETLGLEALRIDGDSGKSTKSTKPGEESVDGESESRESSDSTEAKSSESSKAKSSDSLESSKAKSLESNQTKSSRPTLPSRTTSILITPQRQKDLDDLARVALDEASVTPSVAAVKKLLALYAVASKSSLGTDIVQLAGLYERRAEKDQKLGQLRQLAKVLRVGGEAVRRESTGELASEVGKLASEASQ